MRIIFLNRFYWPDEPATAQLLTDLASQLALRGRQVIVIASHPGRPDVPSTETHRGVQIVRVNGTRWAASRGLAGKAVDFATFYVAALWRLLATARRGDAVVSLTDPPLVGIGAWIVARLRGARVYHWVQDIYPELAIELAGQGWLAAFAPLRDRAWRKSDGCVTLGTDMASVLAGARVNSANIRLAPNWAPAGLTPQGPRAGDALRAEWGLAEKFVVAYSGNLGRVHDLDPVLAVAEALHDAPHIAFVFIGGGAQRKPLEAAAASRGLTNVLFRPPAPRARLAESLAVGDVHLVTLRPRCERYVFPSKLYGIAAVGRPVIFVGPHGCELAQLVLREDIGHAFDRSATVAMARTLRLLAADPAACARLGAAAARFAVAGGGAAGAADFWHELFSERSLAEVNPKAI